MAPTGTALATPQTKPAKPTPEPQPSTTAGRILHTFAWWDHPRGFNTRAETAYTLPTALRYARPCRLADLELSASAGPAAGTVYAGVYFHNVSSSACALNGTPAIEVLDHLGTVWQSNGPDDLVHAGQAPTVVLVPNSWAASGGWAVGASCGNEPVTDRLRVRLPHGSDSRYVALMVGTSRPSHCDFPSRRPQLHQLGVTPFAPMDKPTGTGHFGLMDLFASSLQLPRTVQRGTRLHYRLLLTADTASGSAVGNEVPPLYEEALGGAHAASYELRSDETVIVGQGESVAYDLELAVPADAALGRTSVTFRFLEPDLPPLTGVVTVVPLS